MGFHVLSVDRTTEGVYAARGDALGCAGGLASRGANDDPMWFLEVAAYTAETLERTRVEDHLVDNQGRPVMDVAEEALRLVGWLGCSAGA